MADIRTLQLINFQLQDLNCKLTREIVDLQTNRLENRRIVCHKLYRLSADNTKTNEKLFDTYKALEHTKWNISGVLAIMLFSRPALPT